MEEYYRSKQVYRPRNRLSSSSSDEEELPKIIRKAKSDAAAKKSFAMFEREELRKFIVKKLAKKDEIAAKLKEEEGRKDEGCEPIIKRCIYQGHVVPGVDVEVLADPKPRTHYPCPYWPKRASPESEKKVEVKVEPMAAKETPKAEEVAPKAEEVPPQAPMVTPRAIVMSPKAPIVAPRAMEVPPQAPMVTPRAIVMSPKAPMVTAKTAKVTAKVAKATAKVAKVTAKTRAAKYIPRAATGMPGKPRRGRPPGTGKKQLAKIAGEKEDEADRMEQEIAVLEQKMKENPNAVMEMPTAVSEMPIPLKVKSTGGAESKANAEALRRIREADWRLENAIRRLKIRKTQYLAASQAAEVLRGQQMQPQAAQATLEREMKQQQMAEEQMFLNRKAVSTNERRVSEAALEEQKQAQATLEREMKQQQMAEEQMFLKRKANEQHVSEDQPEAKKLKLDREERHAQKKAEKVAKKQKSLDKFNRTIMMPSLQPPSVVNLDGKNKHAVVDDRYKLDIKLQYSGVFGVTEIGRSLDLKLLAEGFNQSRYKPAINVLAVRLMDSTFAWMWNCGTILICNAPCKRTLIEAELMVTSTIEHVTKVPFPRESHKNATLHTHSVSIGTFPWKINLPKFAKTYGLNSETVLAPSRFAYYVNHTLPGMAAMVHESGLVHVYSMTLDGVENMFSTLFLTIAADPNVKLEEKPTPRALLQSGASSKK